MWECKTVAYINAWLVGIIKTIRTYDIPSGYQTVAVEFNPLGAEAEIFHDNCVKGIAAHGPTAYCARSSGAEVQWNLSITTI